MHIGSVAQILRVNHAEERGAIGIYRGQIAIAKVLHPSVVVPLSKMLAHEEEHFRRFDSILVRRGIRHCYALGFWAFGGWFIGLFTALLGPKAIWSCTAAIESTVNEHLSGQVEFLRSRDAEVLSAVESIRFDEEAHEDHAWNNGGAAGGLYAVLRGGIVSATSFAIWLSTRM